MKQRKTMRLLTTVQAVVMAGVIAVVIFTGWHIVLQYAPHDPYALPHQPYVSVAKGFGSDRLATLGHNMAVHLLDFWRFGA